MENFKILTQTIIQYKKMSLREERLFYYAYGKFQVKLFAISKQNKNENLDDLEDYHNFEIKIDYDEIKLLQNIKRVDANNFKTVKKALMGENCSIDIMDNETNRITSIYIYEQIIFDNKYKQVLVTFTPSIIKLLVKLQTEPYSDIFVKDIQSFKNTYEMKFYLYCLTIFRKQNKVGIITMKIENLRNILSDNTNIPLNNFYSRFISKPSQDIQENNDLKYYVKAERINDNVRINIYERK